MKVSHAFRSLLTCKLIAPTRQFLEIPELDVLSRALNLSTPSLRVSTRVEAYSCKAVSRERKLFKTLESELIQDISHSTSVSPPEQHQGLLDSAFGPLDKRESRKTLWLLIALLNVAFPDHDFSKVRPEEFRREEGPRAVLASLSGALDHLRSPSAQRTFSSFPPTSSFAFPSSPYSDSLALPGTTPTQQMHQLDGSNGDAIATNPFLRQVLDPIIDLAECEVFSYTPDMDSDPHAVDSDDESDDDGGDPDAFERDSEDGGMTWEMDGLETSGSAHHSGLRGGLSGSFGTRGGGMSAFGTGGRGGGSGVGANGRGTSSGWYGSGPATPMKSFASVFARANGGSGSVPGTPASVADSEDYFGESSTGGLLWSTFHFLYNKKMKRLVLITAWARTPLDPNRRRRRTAAKSLLRSRLRANVSDEEDEEEDEDESLAAATGVVAGGTTPTAGNTGPASTSTAAARMKRSASAGSVSIPARRSRRKNKA